MCLKFARLIPALTILFATMFAAAAGESDVPLASQISRLPPNPRQPRSVASGVWNRFQNAWSRRKTRNAVPPIIVVSDAPDAVNGRVRFTDARPMEVNRVYPPRMIVQLPNETYSEQLRDNSPESPSTGDSKDDRSKTNDAKAADSRKSDSRLEATDGSAADGPMVPLSRLFNPLESIDISRAARQVADPESKISFPNNPAAQYLAQPRLDTVHGKSFDKLRQIEVLLLHQPLYFEDQQAERCGVSHGCFTTLSSAAHFFGRIPMLPYLLTARPPDNRVPVESDCSPVHRGLSVSDFKIDSPRPLVAQALAVTALVFIVP